MNLLSLYPHFKHTHWLLIMLSVLLYSLRFWHKYRQPERPYPVLLRILPPVNDSVLLISGLTLAMVAKFSPMSAPWLGIKLILMVIYILLGIMGMRFMTRNKKWALGLYGLSLCCVLTMVWLAHCKLNTECHFFANWI